VLAKDRARVIASASEQTSESLSTLKDVSEVTFEKKVAQVHQCRGLLLAALALIKAKKAKKAANVAQLAAAKARRAANESNLEAVKERASVPVVTASLGSADNRQVSNIAPPSTSPSTNAHPI
jgi:hypothetical protein